jgi:hypothetical protein
MKIRLRPDFFFLNAFPKKRVKNEELKVKQTSP